MTLYPINQIREWPKTWKKNWVGMQCKPIDSTRCRRPQVTQGSAEDPRSRSVLLVPLISILVYVCTY